MDRDGGDLVSELYRVVQWSDDLDSSGVEFLYDEYYGHSL